MASSDLSAERLRELLDYNPETGILTWVNGAGRWGHIKAGSEAGCLHPEGYRILRIDGHTQLAHRLAWLFVNWRWPTHHIDHINGMRSDNRICNLRDVSDSVNMQNIRKARSDSSNGVLGVSPSGRGWRAQIKFNGTSVHLGIYDTTEQAHTAYLAAKRKWHEGCTI